MFERSEFVDPPPEIVQRGKPSRPTCPVCGELWAAFLLLRFLWPSKKMKSFIILLHRSYGKTYELLPRPEKGILLLDLDGTTSTFVNNLTPEH